MKKNIFNYTREFDRKYEYEKNDLGVSCSDKGTVFKLWAPFAGKVKLRLYGRELPPDREHLKDRETGVISTTPQECGENVRILEMEKQDRGVWSLAFPENLHGTYYDFLLWNGEEMTFTADPYARGCSCNGTVSMVVDLSRTNPEGFLEDAAAPGQEETIIYELHIKDFSYDSDSRIPREYRGKYKAFTFSGLEGEYPVGMDYLKQLGVTHIHLLPFFDYGWLDEAGSDRQFNWGYDPVNYNVPEGSFATDPKDGTLRIRECKEMIQALHRAGFRVIMDVVYNHTYEADSWMERSAPGYYYRRLEDGCLSNGSACGNDIAAGRAMVDNYIVNSVLYWAEEYHIDGFRFDLMGLMTVELMNRIRRELDERFGAGEKLLYGEPWSAAESPMEEGNHPASKDSITFLEEGIAVFCDSTRDTVKGNVFFADAPGFVNGGQKLETSVLKSVTGWCGNEKGFCPISCNQIINYVSAHDNHTLWDKLLLSMRPEQFGGSTGEKDYLMPYPDILAANKLAALMYFTCQGHLFLQAGEEFGRTKFGDENSFRSDPAINMLRWQQTVVFRELVAYYQGLISLRKRLPGLCDKSRNALNRISGQTVHGKGVVSFLVDNRQEGTVPEWEELLIAYNSSKKDFTLNALLQTEKNPEIKWEILADADSADCRRMAGEKVTVAAGSGMILGKKSKE